MTLPSIALERLNGDQEPLGNYQGKVLLVVNVASRCGFTPQYSGLESLYRRYKDRGLVVMGFPCNQFGAQEPGTSADIASFCESQFQVSFPMFQKCEVNGPGTHPFFEFLKGSAPGVLGTEGIKWNFTKFLVDRTGEVHKRYGSMDAPDKLQADIEALLKT
ncbi:MAG: glutathione peroxidase [Burkholderiaceae bacterium]|jgi:glutathione peroxidase